MLKPGQTTGFFAACSLAFCLSVAGTIYFCRSMAGGMDMPGGWTMSMMWMRMPGQSWPESAAMFLLMWLAMMMAMMMPSALPMLANYRRSLITQGIARAARPVTLVACGYFFVWLAIGAFVYAAGVAFATATMNSSGLSHAEPLLAGAALILSGCFQFTPWKMAGLRRCRCPQADAKLRTGGTGLTAWRHGLSQGAACALCCSGPMLTLLVLGAMNLTVMLMVAVVIAVEKLMPKPELAVRLFGGMAVSAGLFLLKQPFA